MQPWQPTPRQLEWFRKWSEDLIGPTEIARASIPPVSPSLISQTCSKVGEWLRTMSTDQIFTIRDRQTIIHEKIARDAFAKFYESQVTRTVTDSDGEHGCHVEKEEVSEANVAYLKTAMEAMAAIRKIWGVDAPIKSEVSMRHAEEIEGLPMGQGHASRSDALRAAAKAIMDNADKCEAQEKLLKRP